MTNKESDFKKGLKDGLPLGFGYLSVSFAFGVQASLAGIPVLISLLISMTNLTSAGQLAGVSVVAAAGSFLELILIQLVINSRYFLMSLTLTQRLNDSFTFSKRLLTATFITDEIFAVAAAKPNKISVKYFFGLSVLPYIGWALGTLTGALAGDLLPERVKLSLGIALYAMFLAIIIPPAKKSRGILFTVAVAVALSCAFKYIPCLNSLSEGTSLIICAIIASFAAAALFPVYRKKEADGTDGDGTNGDGAADSSATDSAEIDSNGEVNEAAKTAEAETDTNATDSNGFADTRSEERKTEEEGK